MVDIDSIAVLVAAIVTIIGTYIVYRVYIGRVNVITYIGHVAEFVAEGQEQRHDIYTHSIIVKNMGTRTANNVRVGHYLDPPNVKVFPPVKYWREKTPDATSEIVFPTLVPGEEVQIFYLYFPPLTANQFHAYTKCDEALGREREFILAPKLTKPWLALIWGLILVGVGTLIYWLIRVGGLAFAYGTT